MLAFAMVFTGMGIGSWGVDKAVALTSQDVVFLSAPNENSPRYQIEPIAEQEKSGFQTVKINWRSLILRILRTRTQ